MMRREAVFFGPVVKPLDAAVIDFLKVKAANGHRPAYVRSLRQYLGAFARGRNCAVADVTPDVLRTWFDARNESPSARKSNMGRLSAFFTWASRRGYCNANPIARLDPPRLTPKAPAILTVAQCRTALEWTRANRPDCMAYLALALFAGVRPAELEHPLPRNGHTLVIPAEAAKTRHRRIVQLHPTAVAWLDLGGRLPMPAQTRKRYLHRLRTALSLPAWPQDVLRHTAASYLVALHGARVAAEMLGNSETILHRHYRELVFDAPEFWGILPT